MRLTTLTLKNFRKFRHATLDFPDGLTAVVGLNGAGKSTIFEAVSWVLYGAVAARTPSDQIKRVSAEPRDSCRVELEFDFEEHHYRIIREMSGKSLSASATVTMDGKVAATGAEVVSRFMQKTLGMDFKSFFTSIFAKQKELNTLSSMNASERRPLILKMLGIDSLDEVIKTIRSDKKQKAVLIERLRKDLVDEKGQDRITLLKKGIVESEAKRKELGEIITKLHEQLKQSHQRLQALEKDYKAHKKHYETVTTQKEQLLEKKRLFEQKQHMQEEIQQLHNHIREREQALQKETQNLEAYQHVEKDRDSLEKRLDVIRKSYENLVKQIEKKSTLVEQAKKDIKLITTKQSRIKAMGPKAVCPTCERILGDQHDVLLKKFQGEEQEKQHDLTVYTQDIQRLEEDQRRLSTEQQALQKKNKYLLQQLRQREGIQATIRNLTRELQREQKEYTAKQTKLSSIGDVDFNPKELTSLQQQVATGYAQFQRSLEDYNKQKDETTTLQLNLQKKQSEQQLLEQVMRTNQEKIEELRRFKRQINMEKNSVGYLDLLTDVMASFRTHLISRIQPTLSTYSSDFFARLTDGKYVDVQIDDNYDMIIYDKGVPYNIRRFSGGEEDLANLCLRLAISEVITERAGGAFNFIILDEIFGSQDSIRRQNILKALNSLSSKFRQIFLITHIDDIKHDVENIISIDEQDDGTSRLRI
jgi:exonuclease SbcC